MELIAAGFGVSIQCAVPGAEEVRGNGTLRRRGCFLGLRAPVGCGTKAGGPTREELEMMEMGAKRKTRLGSWGGADKQNKGPLCSTREFTSTRQTPSAQSTELVCA